MNRRGFLGAIAALLAAPKVIFARMTGQFIIAGLTGQPRTRVPFSGAQLYGNGHILVRASGPIKAHSLVVWDSYETQSAGEIPLVRAAESNRDLVQHIELGRAAVTNCDLSKGLYGVATTDGHVTIRAEGTTE